MLVQLTGRNPLWLYPAGLNYFDGDVAYSGFYAGAAGNIDFTAFLLALCAAAMAAALVRGWSGWLLAPFALTMWTLWQLRVAAALREGKLGVMDYYNMQNMISDTAMRDAIAKGGKSDSPASAPRK